MINPRRLRAIAHKEFIHVFRDWRSLWLAIAIPAMLILLFGYALNMDLDDVPTVIWDQSKSVQSRNFISLIDGSQYFEIKEYFSNYRDIQSSLEDGEAMIALVIPSDFASKILADKEVELQAIIDGSDANTAQLALGYTETLGFIYNSKLSFSYMEKKGLSGSGGVIKLEPRAWYNSELRSTNVILPGIIVIVMIVIAAMLTSVTVAREWELGTMEQMISAPVNAQEIVIGKTIPYFVIGLMDVSIAVYLGQWLFKVPLRGSTALLFMLASVFLCGALFFGMLLSIKMKKQVLANQIALISSYLPSLMLSGFVYSIDNMPKAIQGITFLIPARYFIAILKGIYLKGIGLEILWFNALLLFIYAAMMVALANKSLKLKLE